QAGTLLLAGKDNSKKDVHYALTHDLVVNNAKVAQLKSVYINPSNPNFLHQAIMANSADGMGAELDENKPKWKAFGHAGLPLVSLGFCLASDVLLMKEGERTVNISLTVNNLPTNASNERLINNLFEVSITGEKGWIGPKSITPVITST